MVNLSGNFVFSRFAAEMQIFLVFGVSNKKGQVKERGFGQEPPVFGHDFFAFSLLFCLVSSWFFGCPQKRFSRIFFGGGGVY